MIEILSNGALNLVVDEGRPDAISMGVSKGGPMDALALRWANLLVGNAATAAAIEVSIFPFRARFEQDALIAIAGGDCNARFGDHKVPPYWARWVDAGVTLVLEPPRIGARAYVAVAGGINVPEVLGSRSTDLKGGFGGMDGRGLRRGDRLPIGDGCARQRKKTPARSGFGVVPKAVHELFLQLQNNAVTLRCLPAAEYERFQPASRDALVRTEYQVSPESNRTGYRLAGEPLLMDDPSELLSHGIVPGTIQVPRAGQPIIQLADANTCGGYAKIATVIESDLWRLGQVRPGNRLRFQVLHVDEALETLRAHELDSNNLASSVELIAGRV